MYRIVTVALAGVIALALAACSSYRGDAEDSYMRAQQTEPTGSEFDRKLYEGYMEAAGRKRTEFDWDASRRYSDKALDAANGQRVAPDTLRERNLSEESQTELGKARKNLMGLLYTGAGGSNPVEAARAQIAFECWIDEAEKGLQPGADSACREDFYATMASLDRLPYTVFFSFDSTTVDEDGTMMVNRAAAAIKEGRTEKLLVIGHSDQAGSSDYNQALSEQRAEEVKRLLIAAGVPEDKIETVAQGDSRPKVVTAVGTREAGNRRVEIQFAP